MNLLRERDGRFDDDLRLGERLRHQPRAARDRDGSRRWPGPTSPPPTSCGIETSTGTLRARRRSDHGVRIGAETRDRVRRAGRCRAPALPASRARRSVRGPIGQAMLPAALIDDVAATRGDAVLQVPAVRDFGLNGGPLFRGQLRDLEHPAARQQDTPGSTETRRGRRRGCGCTRSSVPAISCATTAELVSTPSTIRLAPDQFRDQSSDAFMNVRTAAGDHDDRASAVPSPRRSAPRRLPQVLAARLGQCCASHSAMRCLSGRSCALPVHHGLADPFEILLRIHRDAVHPVLHASGPRGSDAVFECSQLFQALDFL